MVPLKNKDTRCNLCSLACLVRLRQSPFGAIAPDYRVDAAELRLGLCNRGNMTPELLTHVSRAVGAQVRRDGKSELVPLRAAIGELADAVGTAGALLVVDGNLPCEDVGAAFKLAAASREKISAAVWLPVEDETALDGVAASKATLLTPEELAQCDVILAVGDPFATHPVISKPVHAIRKAHARASLVVLDSIPGKTSMFATHPLTVKPGTESRVLAAVAARLNAGDVGKLGLSIEQAASETGLPADVIAAAADAIGASKKLGVILRAEAGKASNWDQVGYLCGLIASSRGGGVTVCTTYGNAVGAHRLSRAAGAKFEKLAPTTIVLGADPLSLLSARGCSRALEGVKVLAAAAPLTTPTLSAASIALPLAWNFEVGGTTVTGSGETITVDVVADPPGDAASAGKLLAMLAAELVIDGVRRGIEGFEIGKVPEMSSAPIIERGHPPVVAAKDGEFVAVMRSDAIHFHAGSITRQCAWSPVFGATLVRMNAGDAAAQGIVEGEPVLVASSEAEYSAPAHLLKGLAPGVVALSSGFSEARGLFAWENSRGSGPVAVKLACHPAGRAEKSKGVTP